MVQRFRKLTVVWILLVFGLLFVGEYMEKTSFVSQSRAWDTERISPKDGTGQGQAEARLQNIPVYSEGELYAVSEPDFRTVLLRLILFICFLSESSLHVIQERMFFAYAKSALIVPIRFLRELLALLEKDGKKRSPVRKLPNLPLLTQ